MAAVSRVHPRFREPALLLSHLENAPPGARDTYPNASSSARLAQLRESTSNIEPQLPTKTSGGSGRTSPDRRVAFAVEKKFASSQPTATPLGASSRSLPRDNEDDDEDDEPKLFTVLSESNVPPAPRTDFLVLRAPPSVPQSIRDSMESTRSVSPQQPTLALRFSTMSPYRPVQPAQRRAISPSEPVFDNIDDVDDGDAKSWGEGDEDLHDIYNDESKDTNSEKDEKSQDSREHSPMLAYDSVAPNVAADWLSPPRLEHVQHPWYDNSTKSIVVPMRPSARRGDKVFPSPLVKISYDAERHAASEALKSPMKGSHLYSTPQSEASFLQRTPSSTSSHQRGCVPLPRSEAPEPSPPPSRTAVMDLQDDDIDSNIDVFLQESSEALEQEIPKKILHKKSIERNESTDVRRERSSDRHKPDESDPYFLEDGSDVTKERKDIEQTPVVAKKKSSKRLSKEDALENRSQDTSPPIETRTKTPPLGSMAATNKNANNAAQGEEDDTEHALESVVSAAWPIVHSEEEIAAPIESTSRRISRHASLRERKESQRQARQQRRDEEDAIAAQHQRRESDELLAFSVGSIARAHPADPLFVRGDSLRTQSPSMEHHAVASVFRSGGSMNMLKKSQSFERAPSEQQVAPHSEPVEEIAEFHSGGNIKVTSPARVRSAAQEMADALERKRKPKEVTEQDFVSFSSGSIFVPIVRFPDEEEYHSRGMVNVPLKKEEDAADEGNGTTPQDEQPAEEVLEFQSGGNMSVVSPSRIVRETPQSPPEVVEEPPVLLSAGSMRMPRSSLMSTIDETISSPMPRNNSATSRVPASHQHHHYAGNASVGAASLVKSSSSRRAGRGDNFHRDEFAAPPLPPAQSVQADTSSQRALTPVHSTLIPTRSFKVGSTFRSTGSLKVDVPPPPPKIAPPVPRAPSPSVGGSSRGTRGTPRNHSSRKLGTPLSRPRTYPASRPPPAPAAYEKHSP
jgi:hypothetical protein